MGADAWESLDDWWANWGAGNGDDVSVAEGMWDNWWDPSFGGGGGGGLSDWSWGGGVPSGGSPVSVTDGSNSWWKWIQEHLLNTGSNNPAAPGGNALSSLAQTLGKGSQAAGQGRLMESQNDTDRFRALASLYGTAQNAQFQRPMTEMAMAQTRAALPAQRMSNAARGSLMANAQDVRASHPRANVVHFEGSPRPSMLTPSARQLGSTVADQMLGDQQAGDVFTTPEMLPPPTLPDVPEAGFWEQAGQWGAPMLGVLGSLFGGGGQSTNINDLIAKLLLNQQSQ